MNDDIQEPHWADPAMRAGPPIEEEVPEFPDFAMLGRAALCHWGEGEFYRPAGHWSVQVSWVASRGGFAVVPDRLDRSLSHPIGRFITECSREEYLEDNQGYV